MRTLGLAVQTMYADLQQRCLDAAFDRDFPENGSFSTQIKKGRGYVYYSGYDAQGGKYNRYAGPADDPDVSERVARFGQIKTSFQERRRIVRALVAAGLAAADPFTGDLLEALSKAGLFRLRACLVGTVAFQTYSGILGVVLAGAQLRTADADFAQFLSISVEVQDSTPPMIDVLRTVDPSFAEVGHASDGRRTTAYRNAADYRVEFLTPNRGSDDYSGRPPVMPALGGAAAQPLRFLDFLITDPVRAAVLHNAGVAVTVPAPQRYAVHKLIVATRRRESNVEKIDKDLAQASTIIQAMAPRRHHDLYEAWSEAWGRGDAWREALVRGRRMLDEAGQTAFEAALHRACAESGDEPGAVGIETKFSGSSFTPTE